MTTNKIQGIVERVEFTSGGAGNQWTTINGVKYATWWDCRTRDWKVGDTVEFHATNAAVWQGTTPVATAHSIKKMTDASEELGQPGRLKEQDGPPS